MEILKIPFASELPFVVIDCGAREFAIDQRISEAFPRLDVIGFEPDAEECARLNRAYEGRCRFLPATIAARSETRKLYVTRDPRCSSLYEPNRDLLREFGELAAVTGVIETPVVNVVPLDKYLPRMNIRHVDFLKLDVQGAELEVLHGSRNFLKSSILGIQVEVEFSPIYREQPLFGEIDSYIRQHSFVLFDLSRVRYRRSILPDGAETRGQLLWGDALYLRDYRHFDKRSLKLRAAKLALLASACGFHDYALEILQFLCKNADMLTDDEQQQLDRARRSYLLELRRGSSLSKLLPLATLPAFRGIVLRLLDLHRLKQRKSSAWSD